MNQIAWRIGLWDGKGHLHKMFKAWHGISPSEYRKQYWGKKFPEPMPEGRRKRSPIRGGSYKDRIKRHPEKVGRNYPMGKVVFPCRTWGTEAKIAKKLPSKSS